jgi:hypothetical protein
MTDADSGDIATRQETCIVRDGLTAEFRDSVQYQAWRADILQKIPSASDFFIDTAIYWYMAKPDMFETEDGKRWIAEMDERKRASRIIKPIVEEEEEGEDGDDDRPDVPDERREHVLDGSGSGHDGASSSTDAADSAAATDHDASPSADSSRFEDSLSIDEASVGGDSE